jgi:hypothetical protein
MRTVILVVVALLVSTAAQATFVPTPDSAISFKMGDDPRNWTLVFQNGDRGGVIAEFTIDKESIDHWTEMVAQQIDIVPLPLDQHFGNWVTMLKRADPKIVITEEHLADGSILATYDSLSFDELSVRRFVKGSDGVYMLAYHVRHRLKKTDIWNLWTTIVSNALLVPNPLKKR